MDPASQFSFPAPLLADFLPHGYCMRWEPGLVGTHVVADALIALAYFSIPGLLFLFIKRRRDIQFNWIFAAFGVFILACGITHVMDIVTLWVPFYRLAAFFKGVTAVVSVGTVLALYKLMPQIVQIPTPAQMQLVKAAEAALAQALVTVRERDEKLLRDQARVLDLANDSIMIRDNQDRVTYWNQGSQRLYGWSKEEALGQVTHALFQTQFPQPLAEIRTQLLAQGYWKGELSHIRRDGSRITLASNWTLQRDDANDLASVLEINTDITLRKQAEREAAERSVQLKAVNKDLEEFAYVASHDLKAPLRVIDNASKWLEDDLQEHLTGEIAENLNLMRGRVKRMDKLLDDLLEYARIGRDKIIGHSEEMNGALLMDDVLGLVARKDFTIRVSPHFADIQLCRMPLQQILMNLVSNAIKHHDKKTGCIDVTVEEEGQYHTFAVKDDGPGIPARFHDQVFKMFQTLRPRDQVEGSGMGLAMVRKHVEFFGGVIQLESAEGQGSIFRFTWPKQQYLGRQAA
jgi:PAS domain S-box-containing protein